MGWSKHLSNVCSKASLGVNALSSIDSFHKGIHPEITLRFYKSIIRPSLEWGFPLFHNARLGSLKKIQTVQKNALRKSLGSLRITPINILHHIAGTSTLIVKSEYLARWYLTSFSNHPIMAQIKCMSDNLDLRLNRGRYSKNIIFYTMFGFPKMIFFLDFWNPLTFTRTLSHISPIFYQIPT